MMSDPHEPEQRPEGQPEEFPAAGVSLGGLGAGGFDTSLRVGEDGGEQEGAPPPEEGRLELPRGALVAFRKSGGLRFTSRGFVVYRSGWVVPLEGTEGRRRHMTPDARDALEALLLRSGMSRQSHRKARGTRDGYAYEIVAHYGGRIRHTEVEDGAIPDDLRRLIDVLQRLMPR